MENLVSKTLIYLDNKLEKLDITWLLVHKNKLITTFSNDTILEDSENMDRVSYLRRVY